MSLAYSSPDVEAYTYTKDTDNEPVDCYFLNHYYKVNHRYFIILDLFLVIFQDGEHHERERSSIHQSTLALLSGNDLSTPASSGHKMARGSLQAVEAGRLLACGGEHSGHAMLGTATA